MADPWMKFFPTDWRSDAALRLCSRAARGTWIDMLSIMHEANPRGELRVGQVALTPTTLAKLLCECVEDIEADLAELEANGVFSRRKNGCIYSRRMEKDEKKRRILRENGKKGGNPSLLKETKKPALDNQEDKPTEARSQKPDIKKGTTYPKNGRGKIAYSDAFEVFWRAFPDTTNNSKPKTWGVWQRLDLEDQQAAMDALPAYQVLVQSPRGPRCAHATTWLNQRRFETQSETPMEAGNGQLPQSTHQNNTDRHRQAFAGALRAVAASENHGGPEPGADDAGARLRLVSPGQS